MCDVHLVPDVDLIVAVDEEEQCGECEHTLAAGELRRVIEGMLDDGSTERLRYVAHDDCYQFAVSDVSPSGCFTYGRVRRITPKNT